MLGTSNIATHIGRSRKLNIQVTVRIEETLGARELSLQLFIRNIHRRFIPEKHFLFCPFSIIHIIRRFQVLSFALLSIYIMEAVIRIHIVNLNLYFRKNVHRPLHMKHVVLVSQFNII